jgi:F-type H+-transporting ATPase subunit b
MSRYRLILAALLVAVAAIVASPARPLAMQEHAPAAQAERPAAAQPEHAAAPEHAEGEEAHDEGWMPTIAKAVNFALLVGVLVYFLRAPLAAYLDSRIGKVREDLVTAAQTRETATRALAEIEAKLKALPAEIEGLRQRGAEDLIAERARIEEAAEAERQRLLEHTRREIDMRLRVARRELLELTANLAVGIASDRIKGSITPEDQARMVDRYAQQLARGVGGDSPSPREVRQ